jgi:tripartite-type tricarboxylate transporter receptor subunit TctC
MRRMKGFSGSMLFGLMVVLIVLASAGASSSAEKFPSREIAIMAPTAPGGMFEMTGRVLAEYLRKELGVPVIIECRPEAAGIKGILDVFNAKPDGYMLFVNSDFRNALQGILLNPPYKILDSTYLGAYQGGSLQVSVSKGSPYKTLEDLKEASKKKSLNCSLAAIGSFGHWGAIILKKIVGVNLEVVPFKGGPQQMTAVLSGNVDLTVADDLATQQFIEKIRLLAITTENRSKKFPGVPTFKELGYDLPGGAGETYQGLNGPPGLPEEVRKILSDALEKVVKNPEFIDKIEKMGMDPIYMPGPKQRIVAENFAKIAREYKDMFVEKK